LAIAIGLGIGVARLRHQTRAPESFGLIGDNGVTTAAQVGDYLRGKRPKIEGALPVAEVVGAKDFAFGTMYRGDQGEHTFRIRNAGTAPLELRINDSTCKCTVGNLTKNSLAPGEETEVKLTWQISSDSTVFSQSARIGTSDLNVGEITFTIHGNVVDDILFNPGAWSGQQIRSGDKAELLTTAYVYNDKAPLHITESQWLRQQIAQFTEVKIGEPRPINPETDVEHRTAKHARDIKITVNPGLRQGPVAEVFRIRYCFGEEAKKLEECDVCDLNFNGEIVGTVGMFGGSQLKTTDGSFRYAFGDIPLGEEREGKVYLRLRGDEAKDLQAKISLTSPEGVLKAELGEMTAMGNGFRIPLTLKIEPQTTAVERSGRDRDDYGIVEIQFGKPDWAPVRLYTTFRCQ
jgi:hypothetical protein